MPTRVINIKDAPAGWRQNPQFVYIGRPSKWGNPFVVGRHGERGECVKLFERYLEEGGCMLDDIEELRGKTLVCYCKPRACHGDVLARYADEV